MVNIYDIYSVINFIVDKDRSGFVSPEQAGYALDQAQQAFYSRLLPLKDAGDDYATTALIPFKKSVPLTSSIAGILTYPADFGTTEAVYYMIGGKLVSANNVLHVELQEALASVLYPIAASPRYLEESVGIQLYPARLSNITLHYISKPTTPVIGYSIVGNGIVYDPNTSVQLQFSNQYWFDIINAALPYVGVNLSSEAVSQLYSLYNQNAAK